MNRRLQIDISEYEEDEIHKKRQRIQDGDEEEEESQQENEEQEEQEQEEDEDDGDANEQHDHQQLNQQSSSRQAIFESVQTFGNNHPSSSDRRFVDRLLHSRPNISPHSLNQTPIGQRPITQRQEQNSIEEEVARIIKKVNRSRGSSNNGIKAEEKTRIGAINKELLKENTELIGRITQLQNKLEGLGAKNQKKGKQSTSETLAGKLQKYKQKLSRAQALNSKLSSRLTTEKSKSNIISNTFRSMLNQGSSSHISTLRSHVRADSNQLFRIKNTSGLNPKIQSGLCARCCKQMGETSQKQSLSVRYKQGVSNHQKQLIFSPVLQFKNYEINGERSSQFEVTRKLTKEVHCQVNIQETAKIEMLRQLQKQERMLQATIQVNNRKLMQFEQTLYQLVDRT